MDKPNLQSGAGHGNAGHEESDLSIRGIVIFAVVLVVCGVLSFVGSYYFLHGLEWWEKRGEAKLTPMEQKMQDERNPAPAAQPKTAEPEAEASGAQPLPDWYGRGKVEDHLRSTFKTPRLQFDDTHDMDLFLNSENEWLNTAGKGADGKLHIPISEAMDLLAQRGLPPVTGTFSTAGPQMPAPMPTVWMEVPNNAGKPAGGKR